MSRQEGIAWGRVVPGDAQFTWHLLARYFDGVLPEGWFPGEPKEGPFEVTYVVPPSFVDAEIAFAPTGAGVGNLAQALQSAITELQWQKLSWSSRFLYVWDGDKARFIRRRVPYTSTAKPSWGELKDIERRWSIQQAPSTPDDWVDRIVSESHGFLLAAPTNHSSLGDGIHTGAGLAHMPAMAYAANRSAGAGVTFPHGIMRTEGDLAARDPGELAELWTESQAHELLEGVARRTNHLESARNVIRKRIFDMGAPLLLEDAGLGPSASPAEVEEEKFRALEETYSATLPAALDAAMLAEVAKLEAADALPADLSTLKAVLCERLEARTMAKTKELMKAATQQGIDRGFSCVDEERAVKKVAKECVLGSLEIKAAEDEVYVRRRGKWGRIGDPADLPDSEQHKGEAVPADATGSDGQFYRRTGSGIAAAKAAFGAAVKKIEAVTALNVPVWKIGSTRFATPGASHAVTGTEVVVDAAQPTVSPAVPGRVTIGAFVKALYADGKEVGGIRVVHGKDGTAARARVRLPAGETKPVSVEISAINLCGPTNIVVTITPP